MNKLLENFDSEWNRYISQNFFYYGKLPDDEKIIYQKWILEFMNNIKWYGKRKFKIESKYKALISAVALRPVINLNLNYYSWVHTIEIYPNLNSEGKAGTYQRQGKIRLSWKDVQIGLKNNKDGNCVITHEFAHALDMSDGSMDGIPALSGLLYKPWTRTLFEKFNDFQTNRDKWHPFFHKHMRKNSAEFFAYLSELFFENPAFLKSRQPALFKIFCTFYNQNPLNQ